MDDIKPNSSVGLRDTCFTYLIVQIMDYNQMNLFCNLTYYLNNYFKRDISSLANHLTELYPPRIPFFDRTICQS